MALLATLLDCSNLSRIDIALLVQIYFLVWACYLVLLAVYRLYLSPLASIPGPLLARLTYWYHFYYDVYCGGQYTFKIRELHQKYGPIVRINPAEVHFSDPDFYDQVYTGAQQKRDKWQWQTDAFDLDKTMFGACPHELHRIRRASHNPSFSKAKVRALQPRIETIVHKFLGRLKDFKSSQQPVRFDHALGCLSNDVTMEYVFGRSYNRVEHPNFDPVFMVTSLKNTRVTCLMQQFPWLFTIFHSLPQSVVLAMDPTMSLYIDFQKDVQNMTRKTLADHAAQIKPEKPTVLHDILNSDGPPSVKSFEVLWQAGLSLIIAGTVTTGASLAVMTFHLLDQPEQLRKLREELFTAIETVDDFVGLAVLEQLPYLSAVIQEGLRLANGVCTRLARIDPEKSTRYVDRSSSTSKTYTIPPGTPMSLTSLLVHQDPKVYDDPMAFKPERWLGENPPPEKYFVPFTKGTRMCIGLNLAYAELYLVLAHVFRRYGSQDVRMKGDVGYLELFETTVKDIEIVGDYYLPMWPQDSQGVRAIVKEW